MKPTATKDELLAEAKALRARVEVIHAKLQRQGGRLDPMLVAENREANERIAFLLRELGRRYRYRPAPGAAV